MIFFRNNGEEREKYEITFDGEKLEELKRRVTKRCGELNIAKKECKHGWIPHEDWFTGLENEVKHYTCDVHSKISGKKAKEWDHYEEYEVDLYSCEYKDYVCPPLVNFIDKLQYGEKSAIETLFSKDFRKVNAFPKVAEKIKTLQEQIAELKEKYTKRRKAKAEELNQKYQEFNQKPFDVDHQMDNLQKWMSKAKKELQELDKEYEKRMKELNDQLKYLLGIEELNRNQEDIAPYIVELLSLIDIKLVDKITLAEIERVRQFQSKEVPEQSKEKNPEYQKS